MKSINYVLVSTWCHRKRQAFEVFDELGIKPLSDYILRLLRQHSLFRLTSQL